MSELTAVFNTIGTLEVNDADRDKHKLCFIGLIVHAHDATTMLKAFQVILKIAVQPLQKGFQS
jgi:hypothetical protein